MARRGQETRHAPSRPPPSTPDLERPPVRTRADPDPGRRACEHFYGMLGDLEDADYAAHLAVSQRADVATAFADVIASIRETYDYFRRFRSPRH